MVRRLVSRRYPGVTINRMWGIGLDAESGRITSCAMTCDEDRVGRDADRCYDRCLRKNTATLRLRPVRPYARPVSATRAPIPAPPGHYGLQ